MKAKKEVFSCFKSFLAMTEKFSGNKLLTLRTDRGGEYMSHEFNAFFVKEVFHINVWCHIHLNKMVLRSAKIEHS